MPYGMIHAYPYISACDDVIWRQMQLLCIQFSSDCVKQEISAYATTIGVLKLKRPCCVLHNLIITVQYQISCVYVY